MLDLKTTFKNLQGEEILIEEGKPLTLRDVLIGCIMHESETIKLNAEQKFRAYKLGVEMSDSDKIKLKSEDITQIKKAAEEKYAVLIYGQLIEMLGEDK